MGEDWGTFEPVSNRFGASSARPMGVRNFVVVIAK